ncbi:MAG: ribonuclease VapC, partial [Acetobacteraceae bacterium]|nr:ribonuclease VapC [Acetobacteraceae bacterium]
VIQSVTKVLISTVSVVEIKMVIHGRRGARAVIFVDDFLKLPVFEIVPPGLTDMDVAYSAFVAFGKGSGHPAALNFGDVFSYALAKVRGLPLLFKGNDFAETDIEPAMAGHA